MQIQTRILRDEITQNVDKTPYRRMMVYELTVPMPVPQAGYSLFAVLENFTIQTITVRTTEQVKSDSAYGLYDIEDEELIGILRVRPGVKGLRPIQVPDLPANLRGPASVFIRHESGVVMNSGSLIVEITVFGAPTITGHGLDLNHDGIPDDLDGVIITDPPFLNETADDFYAGYDLGVQGIEVTAP